MGRESTSSAGCRRRTASGGCRGGGRGRRRPPPRWGRAQSRAALRASLQRRQGGRDRGARSAWVIGDLRMWTIKRGGWTASSARDFTAVGGAAQARMCRVRGGASVAPRCEGEDKGWKGRRRARLHQSVGRGPLGRGQGLNFDHSTRVTPSPRMSQGTPCPQRRSPLARRVARGRAGPPEQLHHRPGVTAVGSVSRCPEITGNPRDNDAPDLA